MSEAVENTTDTPLDPSFRTALTHVEAILPILGRARPATINMIYQQLLGDIGRTRIRKRPGRSYPRRVTRGERKRPPNRRKTSSCNPKTLT